MLVALPPALLAPPPVPVSSPHPRSAPTITSTASSPLQYREGCTPRRHRCWRWNGGRGWGRGA
eukprot:3414176-Prorocentrum_lima.AAC.1